MKRLLLILSALSIVALVAVPTPAQDRGTRVRVEVDVPGPVTRAAPAYAAPVYAEPTVVYPVYAGTGCRGTIQSGGCIGRAGASCYGKAGGCVGFVPTGGGCQSRMAGCAGSVATGYGFAAPVYTEPVGVPVYAVPVRAPVGRAAPALYAGPRDVYAAGNVQYGASLSNGTYATPTGRPPGPGVFGVPGAGFPFDGPVRRALRGTAGYDPGPAKGTVRAGWVP